jgi:VanZ family protein
VSHDSRRQQRNRWGIVLAYMTALFVLSSIPNPPDLERPGSDKVIHSVLYAGLAVVTARALARGRWFDIRFAHALGALLIAVVYGAFDEFHQSFVAGRTSSLGDLGADTLGAAVTAVGLWVWGILSGKMRSEKSEVR